MLNMKYKFRTQYLIVTSTILFKKRIIELFTLNIKNHSTTSENGIFILSASRTPIGLTNGALHKFSSEYLCSFTLKDNIQRAVLEKEDIKNVFLASSSCEKFEEKIIKRAGLANKTNICSFKDGTTCLREALNFLVKSKKGFCIAGGMESTSQLSFLHFESLHNLTKTKYINVKTLINNNLINYEELKSHRLNDYVNFIKAVKGGFFWDEIIAMNYISQGNHIIINEDEACKKELLEINNLERESYEFTPILGDGGAALVISSEDHIKQNHLTPLAKILAFVNEPVTSNDLFKAYYSAVTKALEKSKVSCTDIVRLEVDSYILEVVVSCIKNFNSNPCIINKSGGYFCTGYLIGTSGIKSICHLSHSLRGGELGCVVMYDYNETVSALVIEKLGLPISNKLHVKLYSKKICPLCTKLKNQLKPFEGHFSFEEVDIEEKGNEKYEELYKFEIPVLFVNGRFLCKHSLNVQQFSRLLEHKNLK